MPITRDQVAKQANVSSATVSRVFNNPESVSEQLRNKVLKVARELNYIPNKAASQLRRSGTGVIGVVKINKVNRLYYWGSLKLFDWFYAQAQKGMLKAIENTSYQLSFYSINSKEELLNISNKVDGIVGYDIDNDVEESFFEDLKIPYVLAHHICPNNKYMHVSTDNEYGGMLQGKYLKNNKVENPIYITGFVDEVLSHQQRLKGIQSVYPSIHVKEIDFLNKKILHQIISNLKSEIKSNQYDGIAFVNDLLLVQIIVKLNIDLPIIGYDGAPYISLINNVSSIDFHIDDIYELALSKVISLINGNKIDGEIIRPSIIE
ncbi:MAG: LacI family DNA-binding transcriptional regulator [Sphaerochaetaceae bacterium]|nr:LacI family DNA-binding transcriptional regulator [Sphaerochaetaceae bacterium]MDC7238400.1 LacI family DNA-binding transcriptional regulator [Sphaerochaetaceae bacterium]MDC7250165.1 LacI family DNA-binding transcriptional regulator [Sphaerochaetaceae bacterium]